MLQTVSLPDTSCENLNFMSATSFANP
jgi:hypothetical protein